MYYQNQRTNHSNPLKWLLAALLAGGVFLHLLLLICPIPETGESLWSSASLWIGSSGYSSAICMAFVLLICINAVLSIAGVCLAIFKQKSALFAFGTGLTVDVLMFMIGLAFEVMGAVGLTVVIFHLLVSVAGMISAVIYGLKYTEKKSSDGHHYDGKRRSLALVLAGFSMLLSLSLFYVPFATFVINDEVYSLVPLGVLSAEYNRIPNMVVFALIFICAAIGIALFLKCFENYASSDSLFVGKVRTSIAFNTLVTGGYFVAGVIWSSLGNSRGGQYTTSSYWPFLLSTGLLIAFAFLARSVDQSSPKDLNRKIMINQIEFFLYGLAITVMTVISALSDILQVTITKPENIAAIKLNGYRVIMTHNRLESGFQLMAFLLIAILTVMAALFIASLVSMIGKSKLFYKITLAEVLAGSVFSLLIGLFGKYYEIAQKINQNVMLSTIKSMLDVDLSTVEFQYKVQSQSFYWFIVVMVIVAVVLIRKPYTKGTLGELTIAAEAPFLSGNEEKDNRDHIYEPNANLPIKADADPCPAFTELDAKAAIFAGEQAQLRSFTYESPTLPGLVQFVVNYARDSRLHLSYTAQDIAAFVAGLGSTRLTILQGMSGTGKTSLPKIFSEAIFGNCEIVEVESSWRDKNELLGYYNEFSRTYTPKKFTQALYKAKLNPERITFIVLDEMNLSRIEYYFSDFLSLMEHEEDKREIKLLGTGLYRTVGGQKYAYRALTDGHTIKIPNNIWFIGTANRDESTFEISDKVYDRAHTMNFNRRAPKVTYQHEPIAPHYLSVDALLYLFEQAKRTVHFDLDSSAVVREVEELLAPYNISFGNRIAGQIETFVAIYASCFTPGEAIIHEALETILLSKVVSKLEFRSVENKSALAAEFRRLRLNKCAEFILKLNED